MILIGQYDSPFTRRVGIALELYCLPFEHRPWSTFGDADRIRTCNPLLRVPTLVLDDGDVLIESHGILDYLDGLVGPERAMFPAAQPERRRALKVAGLAAGISDKAIALFYERVLHEQVSRMWVERCTDQINGTLSALEADRAGREAEYWFGDRIGHADIMVATMMRHLSEAHPGLVAMTEFPALAGHAGRLEALPVFKKIMQPFIPPA